MKNSQPEEVVEGRVKSFTFDAIQTEATNSLDTKSASGSRSRKIKGFANTATIDRGKDLVLPDAFKSSIDKYMENPVMFYNHDWAVPVGTITDFKISDDGLFVEAEVASDFAEADKVWKLVDQGLVRSFSIGFRPVKSDYDPETDVTVIKDMELLEVSIVTIPMNADSTFTTMDGSWKSIMFQPETGGDLVSYKQLVGSDEDAINPEVETKVVEAEEVDDVAVINQPIIQTFSFTEGDCSVCDETDVQGLSWAIEPTGKELVLCLDCFVKQDETWAEDYTQLQEKAELAEVLEESMTTTKLLTDAKLKKITDERDKLVEHVKSDVAGLATKVAKIVI